MKIVVTGGHLTPALAVIAQLKKIDPKIDFCFFGRRQAVEGDKSDSFEYLEVKAANIPFFDIKAGRLQRKLTKYSLISLVKFVPGFFQSLILLKKIQPDFLLTFGGYQALPPVAAAAILRIVVIAHEQTPSLGLANKVIFRLAKLKGVSDRRLFEKLKNSKIVFTGPLLREEIFELHSESLELLQFLEKTKGGKLIYITGGTTGSHFLNLMTKVILRKLLPNCFIIHQTGNLYQSRDFKELTEFKNNLPRKLLAKYFLTEFVNSNDLGSVLKPANLIICRSGANTTSELAALGKVGIVIPLEWGGEQREISKNLSESGSFIVISQKEATPTRMLAEIASIFDNYDNFSQNAKLFAKKFPKSGAAFFAKEILEIT